jgi:hypothetical protein
MWLMLILLLCCSQPFTTYERHCYIDDVEVLCEDGEDDSGDS